MTACAHWASRLSIGARSTGSTPLASLPIFTAYRDRIVNIHPSLLPRHGGPGMYGHHVHEEVLADGDEQSGITIHLVNEQVDGGHILAQFTCPVMPDDTPDTLAERIHPLEYAHFPPTIERYLGSI